MYISKAEEKKNRIISASISAAIFALLLLFLILYKIITPNPPFAPGGGGQELGLGMINVGTGDLEYGSIGEVNDVVAEEKVETTPPAKTNDEAVVTAEGGEDVKLKEETKPEIKNNTTVITPVKVKPKTEAEKLLEKFKKNAGKNGGGIGDSNTEGQNGAPDGDPAKEGNGGTGTGDGNGNGDGKGPGTGDGPGGKYGFSLKGRAIVNPPTLPKDTKEEGKVVVEITVDKNGNVIEANPNGRGTTTSSPILKAKAKQAALATKFNVSGQFEEQTGTITIIFAFN